MFHRAGDIDHPDEVKIYMYNLYCMVKKINEYLVLGSDRVLAFSLEAY